MNSGRRLALAGVAERIKTILTVTGVYGVFSVFPTVDAAQESLRQPANPDFVAAADLDFQVCAPKAQWLL